MIGVALLAAIGCALSVYGYAVELKVAHDTTYKPACDISDKISCTKAFQSPYGKLFGISNTLMGIAFYLLVFVLAIMGYTWLVRILAIAGTLMTGVFGYLLYVKVQSYCVVCTATYVVNILLLVVSFL